MVNCLLAQFRWEFWLSYKLIFPNGPRVIFEPFHTNGINGGPWLIDSAPDSKNT